MLMFEYSRLQDNRYCKAYSKYGFLFTKDLEAES